MLSAYLGITDNNWFAYLRRNEITDEVNFWIPSAPSHKHVEPGTLWLLKLHSPLDFIARCRCVHALLSSAATDGVGCVWHR